jgi:hypothetical protein
VVLPVPGVDLRLQLVAPGQEVSDAGGEPPVQLGQRAPEGRWFQVEAWQQLLGHELPQGRVDLQVGSHVSPSARHELFIDRGCRTTARPSNGGFYQTDLIFRIAEAQG